MSLPSSFREFLRKKEVMTASLLRQISSWESKVEMKVAMKVLR
jgi:hypothetical protein